MSIHESVLDMCIQFKKNIKQIKSMLDGYCKSNKVEATDNMERNNK
ncbi:hypothetical protein [Clostridium tetani]|nr:hypothetical protein [Clostridium tetani]